ncbi:ABC transporter ATP-binding protein [Bifidobacterium eulemuris]|uniref:ABC transporter ATP-binding protein n=1 Tax=Bifidobacterium eulemuris TaxID=1765219 RepID=A0A261FYV4_9BIFI|nr:ABC transporter ATP-binding protein [Bifidobacterium eulemuris]OZG64360.1 sugar ABC transporter [Bifidobacterium eulemuris]QOL32439.1 ABC transporter ATP-binding protein [Bifidobacterium eulemuris]
MRSIEKPSEIMQTLTDDERPVVLKVDHVAKSFRLPTEQANGLKMAFLNWTKGIKGYTEQTVLKDISFEVRQGDFFGIVGRNGSGKSTLLKIISQIYMPEHGSVEISGKLVPFIELGVGFNPELTGRENVYLNGALLGFTREEIDVMYDDIVDFAELNDFMDQKLKNYSSGMQVRLAFSVAIKAQGDILVLDEVLAVGDEAFQRKCDNFFANIKKDQSKTVILVTHSMDAVKKYCNKAILIKDGEIIVSGNKNDVADRYTLENIRDKDSNKQHYEENSATLGLNEIVPVLSAAPVDSPLCNYDSNFNFQVEYEYNGTKPFYMALALHDLTRGGVPYGDSFDLTESGRHIVHFSIPTNMFNNGDYRVIASIHEWDGEHTESAELVAFTNENNACDFSLRDPRGTDNFALISKKALSYQILDPHLATRQF